MTVRGWAKAKDAADKPTPHLTVLASIIGWRAVHKDTGEPYRVAEGSPASGIGSVMKSRQSSTRLAAMHASCQRR
jgi:hypothetical protein